MKKLFLSFLILQFSFLIFAMPGFKSYIPDVSGEYVYYKDNTFVRESYIGILMYDDSTFQVRYYAPEVKSEKLAEMDISLLISIDPTSDYWNMTGERLITPINNTEEEIDVLNYLHDILYEFSSRRNKVTNAIAPENPNYSTTRNFYNNGISVKQDYPQFGGNVYITFDPIIPFFNIKTIFDLSGNMLMQCVVVGKIESSQDTSFSGFKGFGNGKFSTKLEKQNKNAKQTKISSDNLYVTLDSDWTEPIEGYNTVQALGDEAVIFLLVSENNSNEPLYALMTLLRTEIQSNESSYIDLTDFECHLDLSECKVKIIKKAIEIDKNRYISFGIYSKQKNSNNFDVFYLSTTMHAYTVRKNYYDKIIASYKTEN